MMNTKFKGGKAGDETVKVEEAVMAAGKESVERAVKAGSEAMEKAVTFQKQGVDAWVKGVDEVSKLNRQTVETLINAGTVASKGIETIGAETLAFSKARFDDSVGTAKRMFGARTLQEAIELQTDYTKSVIEACMNQSTKVGELAAKVAQEVFSPINAQVQATVDRLMRPVSH